MYVILIYFIQHQVTELPLTPFCNPTPTQNPLEIEGNYILLLVSEDCAANFVMLIIYVNYIANFV